MELEGQHLGDIKLLERMNEQLSSEVNCLRELLKYEQTLVRLLMNKLNIREQVVKTSEEFNPVGGYTPLRDRIRDAELKSRKEADKVSEDAKS